MDGPLFTNDLDPQIYVSLAGSEAYTLTLVGEANPA